MSNEYDVYLRLLGALRTDGGRMLRLPLYLSNLSRSLSRSRSLLLSRSLSMDLLNTDNSEVIFNNDYCNKHL